MSKTAIMLRGEEGGGEGPAGGNFAVAVVVPGFCLIRSRSWLDSPCDREQYETQSGEEREVDYSHFTFS